MKETFNSSCHQQIPGTGRSCQTARVGFIAVALLFITFSVIQGSGGEIAPSIQISNAATISLHGQQTRIEPKGQAITTQVEPSVNIPCPSIVFLKTQLGDLLTACQLTGPTFVSTTQQTNPYTPHNGNLWVNPYGFPSGQPLPPNGNNVTNRHISFNSACNLNTEGVANPNPNIGNNRKVCPRQGRIVGTDLGIPVEFNNNLYFLFGDTSARDATPSADIINIVAAKSPLPITPASCIALTENRTASGVVRDGINRTTFQNYMSPILTAYASQIQSVCGELGSVRAIPVTALTLTVNNVSKIYVWYFTSSETGNCGLTGLNLTGLATSTDGVTFTPVQGATWGPIIMRGDTNPNTLTNEPRFILGALEAGGYVYTYWSKFYRAHYVYIARVRPADVADPFKYEYLVSTASGDTWQRPTAPQKFVPQAKNIFSTPAEGDHTIGEFSINYNAYIGGYIATYFGIGPGSPERPVENSGHYLRVGRDPWGPFPIRRAFQLTNPYEPDWKRQIGNDCFDQSFNGMYGMYTHPRLMSGRDLYFITSSWGHYNTFLMELTLDTGMKSFFGLGIYPINVYASGTPAAGVYPRMQLVVGGTVVKEWTVTGQLARYVYNHPEPVPLSSIRIRYINDAVINNQDRNLRIDRITVGGVTVQTEGPTIRSTGTYSSDNQCGPGYKHSEWLHCLGEFQFHE